MGREVSGSRPSKMSVDGMTSKKGPSDSQVIFLVKQTCFGRVLELRQLAELGVGRRKWVMSCFNT